MEPTSSQNHVGIKGTIENPGVFKLKIFNCTVNGNPRRISIIPFGLGYISRLLRLSSYLTVTVDGKQKKLLVFSSDLEKALPASVPVLRKKTNQIFSDLFASPPQTDASGKKTISPESPPKAPEIKPIADLSTPQHTPTISSSTKAAEDIFSEWQQSVSFDQKTITSYEFLKEFINGNPEDVRLFIKKITDDFFDKIEKESASSIKKEVQAFVKDWDKDPGKQQRLFDFAIAKFNSIKIIAFFKELNITPQSPLFSKEIREIFFNKYKKHQKTFLKHTKLESPLRLVSQPVSLLLPIRLSMKC